MRWLGLIPAAALVVVALYAIWQEFGPSGFFAVLGSTVVVLGGLAYAGGVL